MSGKHHAGLDPENAAQRRVLMQVLLLNAGLALALLAGGVLADSSGLLANALDNMSDAVTYAISYVAVTRSQRWKALAASITGIMLLVLAVGVTIDAVRRFVAGSEPVGPGMVAMALLATAVNAWSLRLLTSFRRADVNLRAAWTMSINDFASNLGIIVAGGLVWILGGSNWPDLAIALVIAGIAIQGGVRTLRDARAEGGDIARASHEPD